MESGDGKTAGSAAPCAFSFAAICAVLFFFALSGLKPWIPRLDLSDAPFTHLAPIREKMFVYSRIYGHNRPIIFGSSELSSTSNVDNDPNHFKDIYQTYATPSTPLVLGSANAHDFFHLTMLGAGVADPGQPIFIFLGVQHFGAPASLIYERRNERWDGTSPERFEIHLDQNMVARAAIAMPSDLRVDYARQALRFITSSNQNENPALYRYLNLTAFGGSFGRVIASAVSPLIYLQILAVDAKEFVLWINDEWKYTYLAPSTKQTKPKPPPPTPDQLEATEPQIRAIAQEASRSNAYGIYDFYWAKYLQNAVLWLDRKVPANSSGPYLLKDSKEWEDFILLCRLIKERQLNAVMVIPPVHGRLYRDLGFDMSGMGEFYARIKGVAKANDITLLSLGDHSDELYWLRDPFHHGWLSNLHYYRLMYNHFHLGGTR